MNTHAILDDRVLNDGDDTTSEEMIRCDARRKQVAAVHSGIG